LGAWSAQRSSDEPRGSCSAPRDAHAHGHACARQASLEMTVPRASRSWLELACRSPRPQRLRSKLRRSSTGSRSRRSIRSRAGFNGS
jgi:hypothetical protein